MAAPSVVQTYPANNDVGIPVGATLLVYFDNVVDLQSVKNSLILHGPDFDFVTGAGSTQFIRDNGLANPYFLTSPGFTGVAPLEVELAYYTLGTTTEVTPADSAKLSEAAAAAANIGHVAKVTLAEEFNAVFAGDTKYTFSIIGDPDTVGHGLSVQTVYSPEDVSVSGSGSLFTAGSHTGGMADTVHVKVTRAGNINDAKYKWWYASAGEGSAVTGRITSAKFRELEEGIKIRFSGDDLQVNDEWQFAVGALQRLAASHQIIFTTNDGSYTEAPESPSTPPTSLPPSTILPGYSTATTTISVKSMTPNDGSYNNSDVHEITVVFSKNPDPASITADTLKLFTYPVEGLYDYAGEKKELAYSYTLSDNILTIRI